jgi:hypothetical protein
MLVTSPSVFSPSLLLRRLATTKSCISWLGASVVYSVVPFSIHQRWLCTGAIRGQCIVRSDMWSEMALVTVMWIHLHFGRTSSARSIMSWYCNSFPALTDPSHEKVSPANGTVSWLYVLWPIFVMFGCGHLCCVLLIPPPHALIQWACIAQTLGPSHDPFIVTCTSLPPMSHWCKFGITKSDFDILPSSLHTILDIGWWGGVCTLFKMLMFSVYRENTMTVAHLEKLDPVRCHHPQ